MEEETTSKDIVWEKNLFSIKTKSNFFPLLLARPSTYIIFLPFCLLRVQKPFQILIFFFLFFKIYLLLFVCVHVSGNAPVHLWARGGTGTP